MSGFNCVAELCGAPALLIASCSGMPVAAAAAADDDARCSTGT